MTNIPTHQSSSDLYRMLLFQRDHPLAFCYGADEKGQLISTTLEQATPLLIIDSTRATYAYLIDALLAQLYTKTDLTKLQVCFIEQQLQVTQFFEQGPLTMFSVKSQSGLMEALTLLEEQLQRRQAQQATLAPWLVLVELEASFYLKPTIRQHLSTLLTSGHDKAMYPILIATEQDMVRTHLPQVFRHTVVLPREEQRAEIDPSTSMRGVFLQSPTSKQGPEREPISLSIPHADPNQIIQLIGLLTTQSTQKQNAS